MEGEDEHSCIIIILSKVGEPFWDSPWGLGRPGWHIECSAMASDIIGETVDLHSGGNDLLFPHHENEVAQAEAYFNCSQWVNYFFHSGHLAINGLKMSKSLKNFITIKQALIRYSARQLRLLFVGQAWDKPMSFSDAAMETAIGREKKLDAFFDNVKGIIRQVDAYSNARWREDEKNLKTRLQEAKVQVKEHLEDNFDTAGALEVLLDLVKDVRHYCDKKIQSKDTPKIGLVKDVAIYATQILCAFGLSSAPSGEFGWGSDASVGVAQSSREETVGPYLDAVISLKEDMRTAALKLPAGPSKDEFLALGDNFRDNTMVNLGVRLEDRVPGSSDAPWKLVDPDVLRGERDEKLKKAKEEKLSKLESQRERQTKELAKWEAAAKDLAELFKGRTLEFSAFDSDGIPSHDSKGVELTSSSKKKIKKEMDQARKHHETLQQKLKTNPQFLESLRIELKKIEDSLKAS